MGTAARSCSGGIGLSAYPLTLFIGVRRVVRFREGDEERRHESLAVS